ncbi:MAG TPA: SURF1 family protein [Limnobacter sp.]|nr:SURF1 family protein [Limnobacter sp.]
MVKAPRTPRRGKLMLTLLLGFGMAALTFNLGQWQTARATQKQALHNQQVAALAAAPITPLQAVVDLDNLSYRKVELKGRFIPGALVYIDNRQVNGRPAVQVVQAFQPDGAEHVVPVDRGYLLRDPREPRVAPPMPGPDLDGPGRGQGVLLQATLLPRFAQAAELQGIGLGEQGNIHQEQNNGQAVWSNFDSLLFEKHVKRPVSNFVLTQQPVLVELGDASAAVSGYDTKQRNGFYHSAVALPEQVAKHRGYAFQWFSMTAALVLLTLFFVYREFYRGKSI